MSERKLDFPRPPKLPFGESSNPGGLNFEEILPALPPDLPLPRFIVKQMRK